MCNSMLARDESVWFTLTVLIFRFIGNDEAVLQRLYRAEPSHFIVVELSPPLNTGMLGTYRQHEHSHRA